MYPKTKTGFNPVACYVLITSALATEGFIAAMNAAGEVKNGADEADFTVVGLIKEVKTDGSIEVECGVFCLLNSSTATIARADRGLPCYLEDGQTVRKTAGAHSVISGLVVDVDADGVWVDMTAQGLAAAKAAVATGLTQMPVQADPTLDASDITDSSGGTASGAHALVAVTDTSATDQSGAINNNNATLAAEYNSLKDDFEALETTVEALLDKLQAGNFMASA